MLKFASSGLTYLREIFDNKMPEHAEVYLSVRGNICPLTIIMSLVQHQLIITDCFVLIFVIIC